MIRILLCGEGPTDQGRKDFVNGEYVNSDGVLQILIKKVSRIDNLIFVVKTRQELKNTVKLYKHYYGKQTVNSKKIAIAACNEKCTHIAYQRMLKLLKIPMLKQSDSAVLKVLIKNSIPICSYLFPGK